MSSVPPPQSTAQEPAQPPASVDTDIPSWPTWTVPAGLLLGLGIYIVVTIPVEVAGIRHPSPALAIALNVVLDLSFVAGALYFTVVRGPGRLVDFGFRRAYPMLAIVAFLMGGIGYYLVTQWYASLFRLHGSDKLPSELGVNNSTAALVAAAVFVCVLAPIAEEFVFRGFVFGTLRRLRVQVAGRELGTWIAALITGVLFGLAHTGSASPQYLVPLGFLGFVLCMLRWRTGSLYPGMALHSVNNAVALGVNQLSWSAGAILALVAGSVLVVGAITGPIGWRNPSIV